MAGAGRQRLEGRSEGRIEAVARLPSAFDDGDAHQEQAGEPGHDQPGGAPG